MLRKFNKNTRLFLFSTLLYGLSFSIWELFFNLYILSMGVHNDLLGLIRSATPFAALVFGLPLGMLSDHIGRRKGMLLGLSICFTGMLFQVHLLNPAMIFFFGLAQGAGFVLYQVSQIPYMMTICEKEHQAAIFSLNFGLMTVATVIGNLIAGQMPSLLHSTFGILPGSPLSYRWVLTAGIILSTTSLIPVFIIKDYHTRPITKFMRPNLLKDFRKLFSQPIVRHLTVINLIQGFGAALLIPYLNVFLRGKFNIDDKLLGLIFSLSSLFVFLGSLTAPWLVRITRSRVIPSVVTQGSSVLFLLSLGFTPVQWIAIISLFFRTVLMQNAMPLLDNFSLLISHPKEHGTISSVRGMGWQLGQTVGIFISGVVQLRFGFSPLFVATSALYAISVILMWRYFRPLEHQLTGNE